MLDATKYINLSLYIYIILLSILPLIFLIFFHPSLSHIYLPPSLPISFSLPISASLPLSFLYLSFSTYVYLTLAFLHICNYKLSDAYPSTDRPDIPAVHQTTNHPFHLASSPHLPHPSITCETQANRTWTSSKAQEIDKVHMWWTVCISKVYSKRNNGGYS